MSLLELIRHRRTEAVATAIPAISATDAADTPVSVARIATVAVANPAAEPLTNDASGLDQVDSSIVVPDQYGHWSESELLLCMDRTRQFIRRGIPELIADQLACRLVQRDRLQDDRRSCAECRSFRNGGCVQGRQPVCGGGVDVLHRCRTFIDPEVKHD